MTRGASPSAYQKVMFDNFEIIANLHLHRFNAAANGIDRILAAAGEGQHMHTHVDLLCGDRQGDGGHASRVGRPNPPASGVSLN